MTPSLRGPAVRTPTGARLPGGAERIVRGVDRRRAPILAVGLLAILTVWVFRRQLFDGWSFPWDFLGTYTTTPAFVAATFGHAHPLSWTPYVASGFPVDVDAQSGIYFPLWWILGALRVPLTLQALTTVQVAHVLFAGVGTLLLARARGLGWAWATLAATAYVLFGGFYGQAEHADIFRGFAYLPWLLWALTPPAADARWWRVAAVPLFAWLIAAGAYPGQIVSYAIAGAVYLAFSLRGDGGVAWRRYRLVLLLVAIASAAICFAVLWPYIRAEQAGELLRTNEPTASARAAFAFGPLDLLGLYLNNFAWTLEGTITTWAVGIPILVGLACVRSRSVRAQLPLLACGALALVLATTPKIGPVGRAMASVHALFPSRFPASDYKAIVALALILVSVDAWSRLTERRGRAAAVAIAAVGGALILGALLAPSTYAQPTGALWLVIAVTVGSMAIALAMAPAIALAPARAAAVAGVLIALVAIDGIRESNDYLLGGVRSPWRIPPEALSPYARRDVYVRELPELLARTPASRPARPPEAEAPEENASGWVADAYHEADYDATRERVFVQAQNSAALYKLLLEPWQAYLFSCASVGCRSGAVHLPPARTWRASAAVRTSSYGVHGIDYEVDLSSPALMVENELAIRGWRSSSPRATPVSAGVPFRAWRLAAGRYRFTARFQEPGREVQYLALLAVLLAWTGALLGVRRAGRRDALAGLSSR